MHHTDGVALLTVNDTILSEGYTIVIPVRLPSEPLDPRTALIERIDMLTMNSLRERLAALSVIGPASRHGLTIRARFRLAG